MAGLSGKVKEYTVSVLYRLRAGGPQPVGGGEAVLQTFGVDKVRVREVEAADDLLASNDFVGNNPDGLFRSASYNATVYSTSPGFGGVVYQGSEEFKEEWAEEEEIISGGQGEFVVSTE